MDAALARPIHIDAPYFLFSDLLDVRAGSDVRITLSKIPGQFAVERWV